MSAKRVRFEPHQEEWWVECEQGHIHYGEYGAAGLLLRSGGDVLLQQRAPWVDSPNTWSIPAGALRKGESPMQGALREAAEEGVGSAGRVDVRYLVDRAKSYTDSHGDWSFFTVVVDTRDRADWTSRQSAEGRLKWLDYDEIAELRDQGRLHPGFAEFFKQHPEIFKEAAS